MSRIKHLPEAVRSSVRSGAGLFDLTRVVEELVFNSLDAGATHISVTLGVETCYVKVVDNGSGVSRDGLMLLGERYVGSTIGIRVRSVLGSYSYSVVAKVGLILAPSPKNIKATSKWHDIVDIDATRSFGFRGEALASIAGVSVLDIVTKARGRPNGYRKVMKGVKCLYLGIDDDIKDVGTTVVVRDLFYNQPVRRKHMQSRPKKVLHLIKKCVLRIALVHSMISFKVVDIESEEELLYARACSSPLVLLMSSFGIKNSSFLRELECDDGVIKLSGFVSGPYTSHDIRVFQYVYINSRFVCKGPIHKLISNLASKFTSVDSEKAKSGFEKGKRSTTQSFPAYMLNIFCPHSLYELTFEPTKTYAEFKDWVRVLSFIEEAIQDLWRSSHGEPLICTVDKDIKGKKRGGLASVEKDFHDADWLEKSGSTSKKSEVQNHELFLNIPWQMQNKDEDWSLCANHDEVEYWQGIQNAVKLKEQAIDVELVELPSSPVRLWDNSLAQGSTNKSTKSGNHLPVSDNDVFFDDCCFVDHHFDSSRKVGKYGDNDILMPVRHNESLKPEPSATRKLEGNQSYYDCGEFCKKRQKLNGSNKPFLRSCSSHGDRLRDAVLFVNEEGCKDSIDNIRTKRKQVSFDDTRDILEIGSSNHGYDLFSRNLWLDETSTAIQLPHPKVEDNLSISVDLLLTPFYDGIGVAEDYVAPNWSVSNRQLFDSGWHTESSKKLQETQQNVGFYAHNSALEANSRSQEQIGCKFKYETLLRSSSTQKHHSSNSTDTEFYAHSQNDPHGGFSPQCSDISFDETFLCSDTLPRDHKQIKKNESQSMGFKQEDMKSSDYCKGRSRRAHSAPPFFRNKKKFISLTQYTQVEEEPNAQGLHNLHTSEPNEMKHPHQYSGMLHPCFKQIFSEDLPCGNKQDVSNTQDIILGNNGFPDGEKFQNTNHVSANDVTTDEDFISKIPEELVNPGAKWRNGSQKLHNSIPSHFNDQNKILDISSEALHLGSDSLFPKSINKKSFAGCKVLQQVDKKFISIIAGGTLAVIDQHAADERIRLEELRRKVLSGEGKTVIYLDMEQELVLPEIGYQLLHNYADQVKDWGWICSIHTQGSRSFTKNLNTLHRQPTYATLVAVPCILDVNLNALDLEEFIQQLGDTDGSATIPPSVFRVLNSKACRGAIMFGDSLLPSECSLIVEELKQTSLCFQCAHGRPTTAPLVNLEALHKQIAKLGALENNSNKPWRGLCREEISLERAARRLSVARGF